MADLVSPQEINEYADYLKSQGQDPHEIEQYKSYLADHHAEDLAQPKEVDMSKMRDYFMQNLKDFHSAQENMVSDSVAPDGQKAPDPKPHEATSILEALEAGWKISTSGLAINQKMPDVLVSEDAPTAYKIAAGSTTLAGDVPAMIAGGLIGEVAGAPAGPIGVLAGAGAGTFALPTAIRQTLVDHYKSGDFQSFGDFWNRSSSIFLDTMKSAATGAVMGPVGKLAGAAAPFLKTPAQLMAEVGTMVTVGKTLDGEVPKADDFVTAAILVGGFHATGVITGKLHDIYAKTGIKPDEVATQALEDPALKEHILSKDPNVPPQYEGAIDPNIEQQNALIRKDKDLVPAEKGLISPDKNQAEPDTVAEAEKNILNKIGEEKPDQRKTYSWDQLYTDLVDKFDPIKNVVDELAGDKELATSSDPYKLARMSVDANSKVQHFLEYGTLDFKTLEKVGPSLKSILEPLGDDLPRFKAYLAALRTAELESRGIKSGFDIKDAAVVGRAGHAEFKDAARKLFEFQNQTLKYLADAGYLSKKAYDGMLDANVFYVPFYRLAEEGSLKGGRSKSNPIKAIKGSDLMIADPLESVANNVAFYLRLAEQNRAKNALIDLAEKSPGQELIKGVKGSGATSNPDEYTKALINLGVPAKIADEATAFSPKRNVLNDDEFAVFRNGKREVYQTNPELVKAIDAMNGDPASTNILFRLAKGVAGFTRLSLSLSPDFQMRNYFRDQLTAGSFTKAKLVPFVDALSAMGNLIRKDEVYQNWLKSGGGSGAYLDIDREYLAKNIFNLSNETGLIKSVRNGLNTSLDYVRAAGELIEQSTRLAEFKKNVGDSTDPSKIMEGGFNSREVTVDFARMGAKVKAFNAITAFQNVQIQGLDRAIRAVKEDPTGVAIKAVASMTLPSVLLWYANKDDERYQALPNWQKDLFWILPLDKWEAVEPGKIPPGTPPYLLRTKNGGTEINNGAILRLPKPQELGLLFATLPERTLDAFFAEHPEQLKEFTDTVTQILVPSLVPNAVQPLIEQYFNKSLFTGNKIIPGPLEGLLPQLQATEYTSETAKILGKMIQSVPGMYESTTAAPLMIDNWIQSWSGNFGKYIVQAADKGLVAAGVAEDVHKPDMTLADIPFVKAFIVRYPSASAQPIQDFYNANAESAKYLDSINKFIKAGKPQEAQEVMQKAGPEKLMKFAAVHTSLGRISESIMSIYASQEVKPDEKRQLIDGLYYQMIEIAKSANDTKTKVLSEWGDN